MCRMKARVSWSSMPTAIGMLQAAASGAGAKMALHGYPVRTQPRGLARVL
jgi:hypothetical protein